MKYPSITVFFNSASDLWCGIAALSSDLVLSAYDQFETATDAHDWALDLIAMRAEMAA